MFVFLLLLLILACKRSIREKPRGVLVIMLTLTGLTSGSVLFTVATADVVTGEAVPLTFCYPVLFFGIGTFVAFKMTVLFLAVDQFVSIVHSLRHYSIMSGWINWMIGMACFCILFFGLLGLACFHFELENTAEFHERVFGVKLHLTQCSWEVMANVFMTTFEVAMLVLAIAVCALIIYTAVLGLRQEKLIAQEEDSQRTRRFVTSFKSFKHIVKVLLMLLAIDIISCVYRVV